MPNSKTVVPFRGTPAQKASLMEAIASHAGQKGSTMPILQAAQEIYGYLPEEVLLTISEETGKSMSELYGVVSFYTQFSVNPKGKHQVAVCMGTACYVKGAADILDQVERKIGCKAGSITSDGEFSVEATRCIGACGLAPVMTVDGDVFGRLVPNDVPGILEKYM